MFSENAKRAFIERDFDALETKEDLNDLVAIMTPWAAITTDDEVGNQEMLKVPSHE